ncbi:MAG: GMC family oxidoreductase, partial [Deltaproteobacteria bacterium]|nr:GMC family oxidoreductase [Deltaproteobacteria bacterium]
WAKFARSTFDSYHHGVGTCMMGLSSNRLSVVDQHLRVHGMSNLWIADASIMPIVTHANTNLTSIMIGERLSDFIKELD